MNSETYKSIRQRLGTQAEVAVLLGVSRECVARRETGKGRIPIEAQLAIEALASRKAEPDSIAGPRVGETQLR